MAAVNSAAHCGRRRSLPWAKEWNGSSARARNGKAAVNPAAAFAAGQLCLCRPPICRNRRRPVNPVTLPLPAAGQSCCPLRPANSAQGSISAAFFALGKGSAKEWNGQQRKGQGKGMDWQQRKGSAAAADMPE